MIMYLILSVIVILTLYCVRINNLHDSDALAYDKSNTIKGLFSLLILFHHLIFEIDIHSPGLEVFKYIAFPLVSVFFFFSGYGLVKSYSKNSLKISLKLFAKKRISKLIIPYTIIIIFYGLYKYIHNPSTFSTREFIMDVLLAKEIGPLWYMTVILIIYAIFGLCFKYCKPISARRIILTITVLYVLLCVFFSVPSQWYSSIIGFYVGIFYGMNESKVRELINSNYYRNLCIIFISFNTLFCSRLIIAAKITNSEILHSAYRSIIDFAFIFFLISLLEIIEIKRPIMCFIGKISYELYLVHPVLIYMLRSKKLADGWFIVIVFSSSIILACLINAINNHISKVFIKK